MTVGVPQRMRFIIIPANGSFDLRITGDAAPNWKIVARDGADLPKEQIVESIAQTRMAVGTTADYEFRPAAPGEYFLQVDLPAGPTGVRGFATRVPIRVKSAVGYPRPGDSPEQRAALEKWAGNGTRLNASDVLWTAFCTVEAGSSKGAARSEICAYYDRKSPKSSADSATLAEARKFVREALERLTPPAR
jgi:hypothetical protein